MTQTNGDPDGVHGAAVTAWFAEHVPDAVAPLDFSLIAGGHSNLTYRVADAAGGRWVLRRPPLGHVLATAHDMGREHKIIAALGPTAVPVPPIAGLCSDDSVNGAPFYVMRFVEGHVVRDAATAHSVLDDAGRRHAGDSIADVLADIHAVDVDAVGLGDLGKKEGYIARQLKRWYSQFQSSNELTGRAVPLVHDVHDALAARIPEQGAPAIVHGDYRLDNCLVDDAGHIAAVLDWELCTLGDPLADLGLLIVYWTEPGDAQQALLAAPTVVEGFPSRAEVVDRYAERSGRDVSSVDFYVAFGYWKLACIIEGVFARYSKGAMGKASGYEGFERQVSGLAELAADRVAALA
ncbi:MAG: phosphotransferase family protein [Acidimicrobiales bacterium]